MTAALIDRMLAAAPELNAAAVDDEHRDPFWWDRYGERGLLFMREDGMHHYQYLAEAVRAGHHHVLTKYVRWLRSVLVTRGMCSEHLADGLRVRARHLAARGWPDAGPALAAFVAAVDALTHADEPAAGLVPDPGEPLPLCAPVAVAHGLDAVSVHHDARHLLSYLADALALGRPDLLHDHLAWRRGFEQRRGRPPAFLPDLLAALTDHAPAGPARDLLRAVQEPTP